MNVPIYIIVISNYIFSLLNCLYEIYNTVITTKEEEEEVNDTIYIYIVCRRGDASVCLTRHHRIIYHDKYIFGTIQEEGNNYLF